MPTRIDRGKFLRLMGASLGLAGLTACAPLPPHQIVPYVRQPEEIVPGKPLFYASATTLGGYAYPILVKTTMGRPIKIEGNPTHPASLGATDSFGQAAVLQLYDPDRSQAITSEGEPRAWEDFLAQLTARTEALRAKRGAGLHVLTETVTSPTLADQLQTLYQQMPLVVWHQYDPVGGDNARAGALQAFGSYVETRYRFDLADVIVSLDADFLSDLPGHVRYSHDFAATRRVATGRTNLSRLYAVASAPSIASGIADHRWWLRASEVGSLANALAAELGLTANAIRPPPPAGVSPDAFRALVQDLQTHRGTSLVVVGEAQPPVVHEIGHRLNQALGNVGSTVFYTDPVEAVPVDQTASLRALVAAMNSGRADVLLILGANPVYQAPVDLGFGDALAKVGFSVHLGLYPDETAARATWHVPQAHDLEAWSDARAFNGSATILQPTIAPLYGGKTAAELLAIVNGQGEPTSLEVTRGYWQRWYRGADFEQFWRASLNDGVVANTAYPPRQVKLTPPAPRAFPAPTGGLEVRFQPDPTMYDGRFANLGWLQELPKPPTQLTWDNVALVSPATAEGLRVQNEDVVELTYRGRTIRAPVWITADQPDSSVTLQLGYGRTRAGSVGTGIGYNAYLLRESSDPWFASEIELRPTGDRYSLAQTQGQDTMQGRPILLAATLPEYQANPHFASAEAGAPDGSLYPPVAYNGYAWGMAIDLSTCIGCKACEIACRAENNIPVVGKEEVGRGRIMHWLRVDRYDEGTAAARQSYYQPVPCMHCENAPCELVCPVAATVHSDEGLNDMVYNRCVGTRYCSNNCPYKVRRFNFFQYADWTTPSLKLLNNPNVTVRERGVMEKCTYCVQRINAARIQAEEAGRAIRDGDVVTACQAACPTQAIVFGNVNDPNSQVSKLKRTPLNYTLLGNLNTRPRTTYLAAVRDPNPAAQG
jgi:molybdopterin-containing oxidoreductase family iron-sulfur binding subunit